MINKREFIQFIEGMSLKTLEELSSYINARIDNKLARAKRVLEDVKR